MAGEVRQRQWWRRLLRSGCVGRLSSNACCNDARAGDAAGSGGPGGRAGGGDAHAPARARGLPDGWQEARDSATGDAYFFFEAADGSVDVQWERPEWPEENLREGWRVLRDADGDAYFWHEPSGETTWEKPRRERQ